MTNNYSQMLPQLIPLLTSFLGSNKTSSSPNNFNAGVLPIISMPQTLPDAAPVSQTNPTTTPQNQMETIQAAPQQKSNSMNQLSQMLGSNSTSGQDPTQMFSNLGGASGGSTAGDAAAAGTDAAAGAGTLGGFGAAAGTDAAITGGEALAEAAPLLLLA